ncbi:MAG: hypothetical protein ACWA6X_12135 [Bauldia sp.]|jgi:hypothetical protein
MTKILDQAIKAVRERPQSEQDSAGVALLEHLAAMRDLHLTDEQVAEVERRRTSGSGTYYSLAEAIERLSRKGV